MAGNSTEEDVATRVGLEHAIHVVRHLPSHVRGHLDAVPGVADRVEQAVLLTGVDEPVHAHVHQSAPAVVDPGILELREDRDHYFMQDAAALLVRSGAGLGESGPTTKRQAVIRCDAQVVQEVLGVGHHPPGGQQLIADLLGEGSVTMMKLPTGPMRTCCQRKGCPFVTIRDDPGAQYVIMSRTSSRSGVGVMLVAVKS